MADRPAAAFENGPTRGIQAGEKFKILRREWAWVVLGLMFLGGCGALIEQCSQHVCR